MENRAKKSVASLAVAALLLLGIGGCDKDDNPTELVAPEIEDQQQPWQTPDLDEGLGPWREDTELARILAGPRARWCWPDRALTLAGNPTNVATDDASWVAVDQLPDRSILYIHRDGRRHGEILISLDPDTSVRILMPTEDTGLIKTATVLVNDATGFHRYRLHGLPAELQQRLQNYSAPFREWSANTATLPEIESNRDLGSWQPFIDRFCAYAFFWNWLSPYDPEIESSVALCDLVYTVMGWWDEAEEEQ